MPVTTQRPTSKQYEASDSTPSRPWERPFGHLDALAHPHVTEVDGREVHWIPGVVLMVVNDEPQLAEDLEALGQLLGRGTTSQGIALVARDVPLGIDHAALGRRGLRALTVRDVRAYLQRSGAGQEADSTAKATELADKYLEDLGRQTRDRVQERGTQMVRGRSD